MAKADSPSTHPALLQQLRDMQRAGITHLPLGSVVAPPPSSQESSAQETPVAKKSPKPLPKDPVAALAQVCGSVAKCKRCSELAETRTQTVFGVGNPTARVLFLGEAPGADEDLQGEPFVGRGGKLLNDIIKASQLKREEIYICNILKCRPPENRNPLPDEADACREYLDAQISIVDPEYIVCWGAVAAQNLLQTKTPIGKLRGTFHPHGNAKVLCTYHPAYLLRNPAMKKPTWDDMQMLMAELGLSANS